MNIETTTGNNSQMMMEPTMAKGPVKLRCLLLVCLATAPVVAADRAPNIIYIMADDLGYGDLSCFGQTHFETPNIDRLAAEGITFTDYYAGSTVCAPTRCVLLTGMHTGHAFVRGNREVNPEGQAPMPADIVTLPRRLKDAGIQLGCSGNGVLVPRVPKVIQLHTLMSFLATTANDRPTAFTQRTCGTTMRR